MSKNRKPRISINKLAEYIYASPNRRKKIIEDCQNPNPFITTWYDSVRPFINRFIVERDVEILNDALNVLKASNRSTEFREKNIDNSIELIEFLKTTDLSKLGNYSLELYEKPNSILNISGVDISVYPNHLIRGNIKGDPIIGGLKINISKTQPLSEDSQKIVSLLIMLYFQGIPEYSDCKVSEKLCLSYDVFKNRLIESPTSKKLRISNIESACEEIAARWR